MRWPADPAARRSHPTQPMTALWFEITARVPPDQVEAVSGLMRDVAPGGVTVEEPIDILGPEMGYRWRWYQAEVYNHAEGRTSAMTDDPHHGSSWDWQGSWSCTR